MEDIITRLSRTQPHCAQWMRNLTNDPLGLAFQFGVVDKWRRAHASDVDALYVRLFEEIAVWVARTGRHLPIPTKEEFAVTVKLYLPMVLGVSWQRLRNLPPPPSLEEVRARLKRSR
ncbi:hypothetical protein GUK36_29875 [Rhizobium leguminosarum]|uniref:Uncharacterized protein n=1 Tax=Rhizobium leguminosarum TaxID=384 RepID=A0A6P0DKR3_RHILE|nr:hypothetical protein [Rhizobium leguminosarum]MDH6276619.1 hypothetical protein [Rhizobium leguminosarum]NEK53614.1 hypothetical protein [Rhizobium leguminosarum]